MGKSAFGLDENLAAAISYLIGPVTGILFLVYEGKSENNSNFVKFHAMQSTIVLGIFMLLTFFIGIFSAIPILGFIFGVVSGLISFTGIVVAIYLFYMAYQGNKFKVPIFGDIAEGLLNR